MQRFAKREPNVQGAGTSVEAACKRLENHLRILRPDLESRLNFPWERSKVLSAMFEGRWTW